MDLITKRIQIIEDQLKINDNNEVNEIMKENINEVKNNTNEQPKKRGRKPKIEGQGWAAELNKAEPDVKKEEVKKHINKTYSYYKNSYTPEQREKCKERSRARYYKLKELKGKGKEEPKRRGRPPKNH